MRAIDARVRQGKEPYKCVLEPYNDARVRQGIGKIPHVAVSRHLIDYEAVLTGQHRTEEVILTNTALVPVSFEIRPHPHDHDPTFHWQQVCLNSQP